jgi:uncharacterized membrane protein YqiK
VLDLSVIEKEFLAAIKKQYARGRRRKVLAYTSVFVVLGLVIAGGAVAGVQIKLAENDAREKRDEALKAKNELQGKLDIIEAERKGRVAAEADKEVEETRRKEAEKDLAAVAKSEEMTKDQLQVANIELRRKVREAQAAEKRAQAAAVAAKKAEEEATKAKATAEAMYQKERALREQQQQQRTKIIDGYLTTKKKKEEP